MTEAARELLTEPPAPKKKRITVASAKQKGRALQQKVCALILARFPNLTPDDAVSRPMGSPGEDIMLSAAARNALGITVECKARNKIAVYDWYEQAAKHAAKGEPLVVLKADRKKPLALVDAEWLLDLLADRARE